MTEERRIVTIADQPGKCPHCSKPIKIEVKRETLTPGVKAETELKVNIEKDDQKTL